MRGTVLFEETLLRAGGAKYRVYFASGKKLYSEWKTEAKKLYGATWRTVLTTLNVTSAVA
jgi:hypothetical protein